MGIVRSTYIIDPKGVVRATWTNVKVKDHVAKVKEELAKLQG
jgi:peroxiredoxin Q/BCP